ncbi:MAG TPA: hypothetical protein VHN14_25975 [Kofleriaceae bacterium]|nr:hypothetical protein [Kofleriaceae bacterium]
MSRDARDMADARRSDRRHDPHRRYMIAAEKACVSNISPWHRTTAHHEAMAMKRGDISGTT